MSGDVVIRAEALGKKYVIGHATQPERKCHVTLRDVIGRTAKGLVRSASDIVRGRAIVAGDTTEEFWALKDVSFDLKRGEVVGIIGRNGAGKSTLLKILSRITEPTEGRVAIKGRVASLLEVGTGFHPELTGRENIYLNGAILGMTRADIRKKFDEIVAFAEVEKFLDTPVKRYSSGMYVRLAFAVAAHLDPEILVVDEVLAVGDVDFQRKCIGAMEHVASLDRTVLLVSHNLALVEQFCRRCMLLDIGALVCSGNTKEVLRNYLRLYSREGNGRDLRPDAARSTLPHFTYVHMADANGAPASIFDMGETICFKLGVCAPHPIYRPWIGVEIRTRQRQLITAIGNREAGDGLSTIDGNREVTCCLSHPNLLAGTYHVDLTLADAKNNLYHRVEAACILQIRVVDVYKSGIPMEEDNGYGVCFMQSAWTLV